MSAVVWATALSCGSLAGAEQVLARGRRFSRGGGVGLLLLLRRLGGGGDVDRQVDVLASFSAAEMLTDEICDTGAGANFRAGPANGDCELFVGFLHGCLRFV